MIIKAIVPIKKKIRELDTLHQSICKLGNLFKNKTKLLPLKIIGNHNFFLIFLLITLDIYSVK